MRTMFEEGLVEKSQGEKHVSYILNDETCFFPGGYKLICSGNHKGLLKCTRVMFNGKTKLIYLTEKYRRLSGLLPTMSGADFFRTVMHLMEGILELRENPLLKCSSIDLSADSIFIDQKTLEVFLIYVPISDSRILMEEQEFDAMLRQDIVWWSQSFTETTGGRLSRLRGRLQDHRLGLSDICREFEADNAGFENQSETWAEEKGRTFPDKALVLRYTGVDRSLEFTIQQDEYVLGRSVYRANGLISGNLRVGNVHCKIVRKDGSYYAIDMGSRNGTWLNGRQLRPGDPSPLKKGDLLKLADCTFLADRL